MNKRTANQIAERLYRDCITRGKYETTQRDYTAVYYPDLDSVVVTYAVEGKEWPKQHVCKVRKAWVY